MSGKITMALVAVVIACVPPALAGGNGNRDKGYTKSAQYCACVGVLNDGVVTGVVEQGHLSQP